MRLARLAILAAILGLLTPRVPVRAQHHDATEPRRTAAQPDAQPADTRDRGVIARLIDAATPGSVLEIPAGVYHERIVIDKPLTLVARGRVVLDGSGRGDIVEVRAPDVTFRGFIVRNTGIDLDLENTGIRVLAANARIEDNVLEDVLFGIDLRDAPNSLIARNRIGGKPLHIARRGDGLRLWRADGSIIEGNEIHDGRDAILWYSSRVTVRNNLGRDCRYALHLMFCDDVRIEHNEFRHNSVGIYLMYSRGVEVRHNRLVRNRGPSGYGLGLKETDRFTVEGNLIAANRAGVYVDGSPFTASGHGVFTANTLACNDVGMTILPSSRGNEIFENNFVDNIDQIAVGGRGSLDHNAFWRDERGNFWSDYTGYDLNADGVGDFVHESHTLFENLLEREPSLRLFLFSPAQQAVEFVGRAIPAVRPEPKFVDEVPLMRPVPIPPSGIDHPADPTRLRLAAVGGALALAGALVVGLARASA